MIMLWSTLHLGLVAFVATTTIGVTLATPIAFSEKSHHDALGTVESPSSAALSTESVLRRSNRRRRSGYDVAEERDVDAFPFSSVMNERDRQRNLMNLERNGNDRELFDADDGYTAEKRGRWAKNNLQIWGKRSHQSDAAADQGGVYPQQHAGNGQPAISLPRISVPATDDGLWSKRKKTWEKNNFKMWGKRADSGIWNDRYTTYFDNDETSDENELRDRLIEAEASTHRLPSWAGRLRTGKGKGALQRDVDEEFKRELIRALIPGANPDRLHHVELERPLMVDDDDDLEPNVALPIPVDSSDRHRLPWYKRGAWATNNMRIWG